MTLTTEAFKGLTRTLLHAWESNIAVLTVTHPLGGIREGDVQLRACEAFEQLHAMINQGTPTDLQANKIENITYDEIDGERDVADINQMFWDIGWTDGLPIIPPTIEKVEQILGRHMGRANEVVGKIPPLNRMLTMKDMAVMATMAGCKPEYLPVIKTAVQASLNEKFNLLGVLTTTHPCGTAVIVNGPVVKELGISYGGNAFGPSSMASVTIGRALRLIYQNIGGATSGDIDKSTQGSPAKIAFCFGENEDANPWEPFHLEKGYLSSDSTVTVFATEGPANINDHGSRSGEDILISLSGAICRSGHNNLYLNGDVFLVLGPEHARLLAKDGWDKKSIRQALYNKARVPAQKLSYDNFLHFTSRHKTDLNIRYEKNDLIPIVESPEQIQILVSGGAGKHSSWLTGFGLSYSVTELIQM